MNLLGVAAVVLSIAAFALTRSVLQRHDRTIRFAWLGAFSILSIPATLFVLHSLHFLPDREWFFTLRSWTGTELFAIFPGAAAGAVTLFIPRLLLGIPLFGAIALASAPWLKPLIAPLKDEDFTGESSGGICLQSTPATCGPASIVNILRKFGLDASEKTVARSCHTYQGGTEAWYLARYIRSRGLSASFDFRDTFAPSAGQPAMVGVRIGRMGHFIAVLSVEQDRVTFVDPLNGQEILPLSDFMKRYEFTGFHLTVAQR